jgi:hypothetical protein
VLCVAFAYAQYPDFIQSLKTQEIFITETQKDTSRIHKIPQAMLTALFTQVSRDVENR